MAEQQDGYVKGFLQHIQPGRTPADFAELTILVDWSDPTVKLMLTRWENRNGLSVYVGAVPEPNTL